MSQQQPPPSAPGTVSPDGQHVWNGSAWVPNPNLAQPPAPKKGHTPRNLGIGCLGLIVLVVIIAVATSLNKSTTTSTPATADKSPTTTASKAPAATAKQLLVLDGTGTKSTQKFTAGGDWDLHYTYDCAAFGAQGNLIISIKNGDGSPQFDNQDVNQLGAKGEDTQHYHKGGTFFLEISSECAWHVDVKG